MTQQNTFTVGAKFQSNGFTHTITEIRGKFVSLESPGNDGQIMKSSMTVKDLGGLIKLGYFVHIK